MVAMILALMFSEDRDTPKLFITLEVVVILGSIALHAVLSLKAGVPNAIITGLLQGIFGSVIAIANTFMWILGLFTGNKLGGMFNINQDAQVAQKQTEAQMNPRLANESPDDYAKRLGFSSADEAEAAGIDTGKYSKRK